MTGWIVQTLVASSLLMLIVFLLRAHVARSFGAQAAYALWLLPVLRMMLPPLPGWHTLGVPTFFIGKGHAIVGLVDPVTASRLVTEAAAPALAQAPVALPLPPLPPLSAPEAVLAPQPAGTDWVAWALLVWLGGALLWFGWQMIRYRLFLARAMEGARPLTRECGIDVLISDHVDGPVASGIVHRRIFLPADFMTRYSPEERRLALVHEAAHHDRRDIVANLVGLMALALHWWNPFAYRAYRAFRSDQELACDATVLADAAPGDRLAYGSAVIKSVSARMPGVACALSHKAELKQRIRMMARKPMGMPRLVAGGLLAVSAIGGGLLLTATGNAAENRQMISFTGPAPADVEAARREADRAQREADKAGREAESHAARAQRHADAARRHADALVAEVERAADRAASRADFRSHRADEAARQADRISRKADMASHQADMLAHVADLRAEAATREARLSAVRVAYAGVDAQRIAQATIANTRANLAAHCAAKGMPMATDAGWGELATCGHLRESVRGAMEHARLAIASAPMGDAERTEAMAGLDRAMAEMDRRLSADQPSF